MKRTSILWLAVPLALLAAATPLSAGAANPPQQPITSTPTPTPDPTHTPNPTPPPTPTPNPPVVNLSAASGPPGTKVTITGTNFAPRQPVGLFIDSPSTPIGTAVADAQGNLNAAITIPTLAEGAHSVCAAAGITPACAQFQVEAPPTPTPSPTPTPTATPSPTPSATPVAAATSQPTSSSGGLLGALFPWILIPILLLLAAGGGAAYLIWRSRDVEPPGPGRPIRPVPAPRPGPVTPHSTNLPPVPPGAGQMTVTHSTPTPAAPQAPQPPPAGTWQPGGTWPPPPPPGGIRPAGGDDAADLPEPGD